jgi:hypothetical protein
MGILIYSSYVQKILKNFKIGKVYPDKTPMVVRTLEIVTDQFRPKEEGEEVLDPGYTHLSCHIPKFPFRNMNGFP